MFVRFNNSTLMIILLVNVDASISKEVLHIIYNVKFVFVAGVIFRFCLDVEI